MRPAAPQATGKNMCILRSFARFASLALMTIDAAATAKGIAESRATCMMHTIITMRKAYFLYQTART